ncbi:MAG TPA: type II toxin-antitoxin system HicB family antitoxin [Dehalococcoidia bacterium]|nr:type II toxin-antitoxin system HicB family antitoxin [Dehalococcoidia bacterium]
MKKDLHAVIYKGEASDQWVAFCLEYDIASQGDTEKNALEMLQEAVELHLEEITPEELDHINNEVGSEPVIKKFSIRAPAVLDH